MVLIPLLPFIGFILQVTLGRLLGHATGYLATAVLLACHGLGWCAYQELPISQNVMEWISIGSLQIDFSFHLDGLSGLMTLFITGIASLIHLYSVAYMHEDKTPWKFFAYLNLFCGMMLVLVLGDSLPLMFLGWEGVGLCSYLLIGYWHQEMANAQAAQKAFVANRVGDFFFIIGMFLLYQATGGSLGMDAVNHLPASAPQLATALFCLFLGACGKSAQIPLYVWLPDAMAGPTPVSALIHAATMVTSGLYLVARLWPVFALCPEVLEVMAWTGAGTALLAALIALTQTDIKKVLAYSTVSQLGFMFAGMGCGAPDAGIFHVFTHAFFKALLFLGAGSVILACHHEQDLRQMGGLKSSTKITHLTMLIGCLAIAGLPFLSGFTSKEEILGAAWSHGPMGLYWVLLGTAVLTSFYMFRLYFLAFHGSYRGHAHPHESPWQVTLPLLLLAAGSILAGRVHVGSIMGFEHEAAHEMLLMVLGTLAFAVGLSGAWFFYKKRGALPESGTRRSSSLANLSLNKFYVDEIYEVLFLGPVMVGSRILHGLGDRLLIEGLVNGSAKVVASLGMALRTLQTGRVGHYALAMGLGVLALLAMVMGVI